jgi:uncharacterized membrane protein YfhO
MNYPFRFYIDWKFYQMLPQNLFFFGKNTSFIVIFPIIVYFLLLYGFFIRERQTRIRFLFTCFIFLLVLIPYSYSFFNGLSTIQYRWLYLFVFTVAHVLAFILDHLLKKQDRYTYHYFITLLIVLVGMFIYKDLTQIASMKGNYHQYIDYLTLAFGIATFIVLIFIRKIPKKWYRSY